MKDCTGRDILEGDLITYPVRARSQMWMNQAIVTVVGEDYIEVEKFLGASTHRKARIKDVSRTTIALRASQILDFNDMNEYLTPEEFYG